MRFYSAIFYLMILPGIPGICHSQDFHSGVRAGLTASQVDGDNLSGFNKAGFLAGIYVERGFSGSLSLQMEMDFIQKGSRKPLNKEDNTYYRLRLHYVQVPLLLKARIHEKWNALAGPAFGVLVFSAEDDQLGIINFLPDFKKFEWSALAGIQYKLSDDWFVDARYSYSIIPVRPFEGSFNIDYFDRGQYNSVLEFSLQYHF